MKTFETAADVLGNAQDFHRQAAALYGDLQAQHPTERVRMLLGFLRDHELRKEKALATFVGHASEKLLGTWLQYTPEEIPANFLAGLGTHPAMSLEEVAAMGQAVDSYLMNMFDDLSSNAGCEELREVFANLMTMERAEKLSLTRAAHNASWDL